MYLGENLRPRLLSFKSRRLIRLLLLFVAITNKHSIYLLRYKGEVNLIKFYDTSALLDSYTTILPSATPFLIALTTLQELESLKTGSRDSEVKYRVRKLLLALNTYRADYDIINYPEAKMYLEARDYYVINDNIIMAQAAMYQEREDTKIMFVTSDLSCYFIATEQFKLASTLYEPNKRAVDYKGYLRICLTDLELAEFYMDHGLGLDKEFNLFGALRNQYIILENENHVVVDFYKWTGQKHISLNYQTLKNPYMGIVQPANAEQKLVFDLLQDDEITIKILTGGQGVGEFFAPIL